MGSLRDWEGREAADTAPLPLRATFAQLATRKPRLLRLKARAHVELIDKDRKTGDGAYCLAYGRWLGGRPCCILAVCR